MASAIGKSSSKTQTHNPTAPKTNSNSAPTTPVDSRSRDETLLTGESSKQKPSEGFDQLVAGFRENYDPGPVMAIDALTTRDHEHWGQQVTDPKGNILKPGFQETDESHFEVVGDYWSVTELPGYDGKDTDQPWSAAYVSSVHERAGVSNFDTSVRHSTYIKSAIDARNETDSSAAYWGFRPEERAPEPGDLLCWNRAGSSATFDNQQQGRYESHCDFVKSINDGTITTLGGNVGHSVSTREFTIDENGFLNDSSQDWLAVLAPNDLRWDVPSLQ